MGEAFHEWYECEMNKMFFDAILRRAKKLDKRQFVEDMRVHLREESLKQDAIIDGVICKLEEN